MASYRRRRRSYRRRSYRRYARGSGGTVRRAIGNLKAARQQKDSATVNINILCKTECCQLVKYVYDATQRGARNTDGAYYVPYNCGNAFVNVYDVLRRSDFFNCYAPMYDQFKIDMVRCKLTPTAYPNDNTSVSYTILTAWDRTGLSSDQFVLLQMDESSDVENPIKKYYFLGPAQGSISSYSSAITKNVNKGSSFSIVRYLYPSTQTEKGQYISTKTLLPSCQKVDDAFHKVAYDFGDHANTASTSLADPTNPCDPLETPMIGFKPTLLVGILGQNDLDPASKTGYAGENPFPNDNVIPNIYFNIEFDIAVTFRGLRKTQIV